jgi:hypothetical protein
LVTITGSNTRDAVEISSLRDGPVSCQDPHFPKSCNMKNK